MANCPICDKPSQKQYAPFCCERCQQVDLGRWFSGNYSTPVIEEDDIPEDELNQLYRDEP